MNINKIISETLDTYIKEHIFEESKSEKEEKIEKSHNRDGHDISTGDENKIRNIIRKSDIINVAALARKLYPNHTPEGAQSQLRKKIEGDKNDNGSEYHLKEREANAISKIIHKL